MNYSEDTICALATAAVEAGIGIIRVSGKDAVAIVSLVARTKSGKPLDISTSHQIKYGFVYEDGKPLDEVLFLTMLGPRSYTGEDTVEIDCHGGVLMMKKLLRAIVANGARIAEPGEFTKRAFLNGRIDLSEAEAVGDIISSKNDMALHAGVSQLRGSVSEEIRNIRASILEDDAYIEAALDDPEHISLDGFDERLKNHIELALQNVRKLISTYDDGRLMKEGIRTVIVGKPNAGKSSILNVLVGQDRAIVTDIAGTTRDTLEENISISGVSLSIVDTAGIRETDDVVEKIGVERALKAADTADLIIYVVDSSVKLDESDDKIINYIQGRKCIVLMNKSDLETVVSEDKLRELTGTEVIQVSAKNRDGIKDMEEHIKDMFYHNDISFNSEVIITSERQKALLDNAEKSLMQVQQSIDDHMPEDFYTIDLMSAYENLGYILGEEISEDLINEIFSKFCMGK